MDARKKQRLGPKTWTEASNFIEEKDGFVSTSLEFSDSSRQVKTTQKIHKK
jgi:hypothetical protein